MPWANRNVRTTEWVLEEMYQTGRLWMNDVARRRRLARVGPDDDSFEAAREDLRRRFEHLYSEFCDRVDGK